MSLRLSPLTQQLVEHLFEPSEQAEASRRLIEECGNNLPFFLSTHNFNKVIRGEPLAPEDIEAWIARIRVWISKYLTKKQNAVFACSMLKESYRQALRVSEEVHFVYLRGTHEQLEERQKNRKSGLPHLERLAYEYNLFEAPRDALAEDIDRSPQDIVDSIRRELQI